VVSFDQSVEPRGQMSNYLEEDLQKLCELTDLD